MTTLNDNQTQNSIVHVNHQSERTNEEATEITTAANEAAEQETETPVCDAEQDLTPFANLTPTKPDNAFSVGELLPSIIAMDSVNRDFSSMFGVDKEELPSDYSIALDFDHSTRDKLTVEEQVIIKHLDKLGIFFQQEAKNLKQWYQVRLKQDNTLDITTVDEDVYNKLTEGGEKSLLRTGRALCPVQPFQFEPNNPESIVKVFGSKKVRINTAPCFRVNPYVDQEKVDKCKELLSSLMAELYPIEAERKHVLQFIAHIFQKPEERPQHCLLITGQQSVGKSFLLNDMIHGLLGKYCKFVTDFNNLSDRHEMSLFQSLAVVFDDVPWTRKFQTEENWKRYITTLQSRFNEKHEKAFTANVYSRVIIISNKAQPITDLTEESRRWFIPQYSRYEQGLDRDQHLEKLSPVLDELRAMWTETPEALINYFLSVDLSDFQVRIPPKTETLMSMVAQNLDTDADITEWLEEKKVFGIKEIQAAFPDYSTRPNEYKALIQSLGYEGYVKRGTATIKHPFRTALYYKRDEFSKEREAKDYYALREDRPDRMI